MVKYALIIAFTYNRNPAANYELSKLTCTSHDLIMIYKICKKFDIDDSNITIITDLSVLPSSKLYDTNIKITPYADDIFVCREISQFIENTIRGIEENLVKNENEPSEILLYISGHGSEINIDGKNEQSIILTSDNGSELRFLLSKDLFNIIFGNLSITEDGVMSVPIYRKIDKYVRIDTDTQKKSRIFQIGKEENIFVQLQKPISSPVHSPSVDNFSVFSTYRSSYLTNRGLPFYSKLLAIIDTCYSAHMTQFPFIYDSKHQTMIPCNYFNIDLHEDLPYCVAISSCESNKTSRFTSSGSALTKILHNNLLRCNGTLNISQLNYVVYSSDSSIINHLLRTESSHPIITSTSNDVDCNIPFFGNRVKKPMKVIEK